MPRLLAIALVLLGLHPLASTAAAQPEPQPAPEPVVAPTPADVRLAGFEQRQRLLETSLLGNVPLRNVGPTVMSGRVVDVEADPDDPTRFFVAYASSGLWETTNNGQSFEPRFDDQAVMTLGDIAVDWRDPEGDGPTVWVGTGENNSSRSSYAGAGVYKSTDGGETWTHLGLAATQRTGRIVLHPDDPETAWVAAAGPLYHAGPDRGVYLTTDGGATWTRTLAGGLDAGAIDLVLDPQDADVLYASLWERSRRAWDFVEGGPDSGIYKSSDGGRTWTRLTVEGSGFPTGDTVGRIGLAAAPGRLYAVVDNQARRPPEEDDDDDEGLTRDALRAMSAETFLALAEDDIETYLRTNGFPAKYTVDHIVQMVRDGEIEPLALVEYLEDANQQLFDTPVIGAEVYRSDDGGASWTRTHEDYLDALYYSYGYYFGEIRVAPDDPERLYVMGVPILKSEDGGATWARMDAPHVHVDHHALWLNPRRPGHLINGNDGGINITYDDGATWVKANQPPVGQFYAVQVDDAEPYRVYGGLQDNGVWVGPSTYDYDYGWYASGDYPYDRLLGGDGMQIEVDTRTNETVYTGYQFGFYVRVDQATGARSSIRPRHELGERPLRFNWQTPIHLSRHQQDILYLGSNKLHRSLDRGETWTDLSGDLTLGGRPGDVPYGTLTTIDESPLRFGVLYVGTDDGLVHASRDGGTTWQRVVDGLPPHLWVSRVEASHHAEGRVYVALNGYRYDHFDAHVYRSDDYGRTWTRLGTDAAADGAPGAGLALPPEPVNVVLEDPANEDVLYVGTDHGLYVSLDRGRSFMALMGTMPHAPVHDLKLQVREQELVVGTHGRSIYIAPVAHVQALTEAVRAEALHAFEVASVRHREGWGTRRAAWAEYQTPEVTVPYYSRADGVTELRVEAEDGTVLQTWADTTEAGLNYAAYDLTVTEAGAEALRAAAAEDEDDDAADRLEPRDDGRVYLPPGTYAVVLRRGDAEARTELVVRSADDRDGDGEAPSVFGPGRAQKVK